MQNGILEVNCELFQCTCTCDITAGQCDYDCCCDPDCSADQISRFQTIDACLPEGLQDTQVQMCYSSVELATINPKLPLSGKPTAQSAVGDALCVYKYNAAMKEEYYLKSSLQSSDVFFQPEGQKRFSYGDVTPVATTLDSHYDKVSRGRAGGTQSKGPMEEAVERCLCSRRAALGRRRGSFPFPSPFLASAP